MSSFPRGVRPVGPIISPWSVESIGLLVRATVSTVNAASAAYPAANVALFYPFALKMPTTITKVFAENGASAANNVDIGVYDEYGTRIFSTGSTARAGTTTAQVIDVTDITIGPGRFYMAIAQDNTTGSYLANSGGSTINAKMFGIYEQTTAFPLPATATFATYARASTYIPFFGLLIAPFTLV